MSEANPIYNSGHNHYPLRLWDCPVCTENERAELKSKIAKLEAVKEKYYELIYGVATVFPNESRHQTALRYIQEQENRSLGEGQVALADLEDSE